MANSASIPRFVSWFSTPACYWLFANSYRLMDSLTSLFRRTHRESFFSSLFLQRSWPTYSRPRPSRPSPDLVSPPRVPSWASTLQEAATPPQPGCSVDDHRHWQRGRPHPNPRGPCAVRPWAAVLPNRVPCSYENPYSIPPRAWAAVAGLPWPRWETRWPR